MVVVYPVFIYIHITLLLTFKSFGWWNTLFFVRLMVVFISIIHIRYCVIPPNISLYYPYKILRYWWPQPGVIYLYIHIRYCVIGYDNTFPLSLSPLSHTIFNNYYIFPIFPISPYLPLYLYTPIYICSIFHTILCKYSGHLSHGIIYRRSSIYLSIYLVLSISLISPLISYLISIIFIINITYIYLYPITYIPMTTYVLYLL